MSLISINLDNCKQDGHCANVCPGKLISLDTLSKFPEAITGAEKNCIKCGHCVAVCPHEAISVTGIMVDDCAPILSENKTTENQIEQLVKSRRSIRNYKSTKVENEVLSKIIDIARYAPTGSNSQQVEWLVINSPEIVSEFSKKTIDFFRTIAKAGHPIAAKYNVDSIIKRWESGHDVIFRNAPALVVAHAPKINRSSSVNCTIALSYLDLVASTYGLGCCWAGFFMTATTQSPEIIQALDLPEGNVLMGALMIGYPKYQYHRIPPRKRAQIIWRS